MQKLVPVIKIDFKTNTEIGHPDWLDISEIIVTEPIKLKGVTRLMFITGSGTYALINGVDQMMSLLTAQDFISIDRGVALNKDNTSDVDFDQELMVIVVNSSFKKMLSISKSNFKKVKEFFTRK